MLITQFFLPLLVSGALSSLAFAAQPTQNPFVAESEAYGVKDQADLDYLLLDNDGFKRAMQEVDPAYAAVLDEPRLVEVFGSERRWMTEGDKLRLKQQGFSFFDLTNFEEYEVKQSVASGDIPWPEVHMQSAVHDVIQSLSLASMKASLEVFTSFYNRFYRSDYGVRSSRWLFNRLLEIIASAPPSARLSLETFTHSFPQPTLIARFEPAGGRTASPHPPADALPIVILGAHQDSANYAFPHLRAPGADDDGSGAVVLLEAFAALVGAGFTPAGAVEFHWYAAEEGGLLGSQEVVREYVGAGRRVGAMVQFDGVAWVLPGSTPTVTLINTEVDASLTNWTIGLASTYCARPAKEGKLKPRQGSDHMAWHRAGFPAVYAAEGDPRVGEQNPWDHTVDDRWDVPEFSFDHAMEFAKLAVAFAVELGGWVV
ncbi:Zn-dependent exopeptidase [Coniophora puteana RWD-64-598 SS2]|uniref:Peptide hydrolase n=1 Tax=Coniophora puteana (strain RWD-64-598) TaxID=741705 RepID=A0A5M3MN61_CONPW|nr:Zn-dependent exopeptidase [Coniophora puteana RWD-64-598 SS2]EIW80051.1 Zn-dependent exopeptidase [Coniophora puteana RWD-64-598 SS2]